MKNRILWAALAVIAAMSSTSAQMSDKLEMAQIQSDEDYFSAEATARSREGAIQDADKELLMRVVGGVIHEQTDIIKTEKEEGVKEDYQRKSQTFIITYLKGLQHLAIEEKKNRWLALSYIHRDSLAHSLELRKARIREFHRLGMNAAREGRIGESLRNLYWGFLLSHAYFDTLEMELPSGNMSAIPKQAFTCMIKLALEDIQIRADDCYRDGPKIIAPLTFTFDGQRISELQITYYGGSEGMDHFPVEDGFGAIPFYDEPAAPWSKKTFNIDYAAESDMNTDAEIHALYEVFKEKSKFDGAKNVDLHFPWVRPGGEAPPPPPPPDTGGVSSIFKEALWMLGQQTEYSEFADYIQQYLKLNALLVGRPEDFGDRAGCYVVIIDGRRILDLLSFDGCNSRSVRSGEIYSDPMIEFPDKGQLWFKEKK